MDLPAAASRGDENAVRTLLDGGIVVTKNWHMDRPPLCLAAGNGHIGVVKLLVKKGKFDPGDVDERERTALSWAASRGHKKVVEYLLARKDTNTESADDEGWTPLSWACAKGFAPVVKLLLNKRANVNSKDKGGRTPLSWAAEKGQKDVVKALLASGSIDVKTDVDKRNRTPFLWAVAKGKKEHRDIMKKLIAKDKTCLDLKDNDGRTPLSWAAGYGNVKAAEILLKEKVDIRSLDNEERTPLSWAAEKGHKEVVELLLAKDKKIRRQVALSGASSANTITDSIVDSKDANGRTPILFAARSGHDKVVTLLIARRTVTVDAKDSTGRTPLSWAAGEGHDAVVDVLLPLRGVDPNNFDNEGQTPLSWAAMEGHRGVTWKLLRRQGIQPNLPRDVDTHTPLLLATEKGFHAVARELLAHSRIDNTAKDSEGRTPLMLAYHLKHEKTVKVLIENKAGLEVPNPDGLTILMLAARDGKDALVQLLIAHDADSNARNPMYNNFAALNYAAGRSHDGIVQQLRAAMKKQRAAAQASNPAANHPGTQNSRIQVLATQNPATSAIPSAIVAPPPSSAISMPPSPAQSLVVAPIRAPAPQSTAPQNTSSSAPVPTIHAPESLAPSNPILIIPVTVAPASQNAAAMSQNTANYPVSAATPPLPEVVAQVMATAMNAPVTQARLMSSQTF